jgi:hypothetical protein
MYPGSNSILLPLEGFMSSGDRFLSKYYYKSFPQLNGLQGSRKDVFMLGSNEFLNENKKISNGKIASNRCGSQREFNACMCFWVAILTKYRISFFIQMFKQGPNEMVKLKMFMNLIGFEKS